MNRSRIVVVDRDVWVVLNFWFRYFQTVEFVFLSQVILF